ncbi:MAG: glycosyltransferase family 9 protein, partial [Candidatus Omnitrophica bacterium]|nr:glycosyltransferase family 9 protein [Candidatus Omnitrophota bacterium]
MSEDILINFPTNLGDAIIGLPVLDRLKTNYPQARITAIVSSKTKDFLLKNNCLDEVVVFDKTWSFKQKLNFALSLRGKYTVMADLKNTLLPFVLGVKRKTSSLRYWPKTQHIKDEYLELIDKIAPRPAESASQFLLSEEQSEKYRSLNLKPSIFVACASKERLKQYPYEYLRRVIEPLSKKYCLAILGLTEERVFYKDILSLSGVVDLVGKTQMDEVYFLLKNYARLLLCVDSSIMHLGSYLQLPIVALFGPSNPKRYGPWSENFSVLTRKDILQADLKEKDYQARLEYMKID